MVVIRGFAKAPVYVLTSFRPNMNSRGFRPSADPSSEQNQDGYRVLGVGRCVLAVFRGSWCCCHSFQISI